MYFQRNLEQAVHESLRHFPVVVVVGARQSGKTTLARTLKPDWHYFDLENGADFDFITRDPDFFFSQYSGDLILDEAQVAPELFKELRGVIDSDRQRKGRFLLTGSSSPELTRHVSESLAGRVAMLELGTMKMNERYGAGLSPFYSVLNETDVGTHLTSLRTLPVPFTVDDVLYHFLHGGYPEPTEVDTEDYYLQWNAQYQRTYLERDVRARFPGMNGENFRRFVTMLSELSGTILNRSEIGRSLNCSESAVRDYLSIAEGTYIWRSLPALEKSVSKSIVKMPRGYVRDSGLLHHLNRVRSKEQLLGRPGTGAAFEGFIIEEIHQGLETLAPLLWKHHYYRTRGGAEVDLILTSPHGVRIPVEIKFGTKTRKSDLRSLQAFIQNEGCPYGILINNSEEVRLIAPQILQIPSGSL